MLEGKSISIRVRIVQEPRRKLFIRETRIDTRHLKHEYVSREGYGERFFQVGWSRDKGAYLNYHAQVVSKHGT